MAKAKGFLSYLDNIDQLNMLSDEQAGRLYKALFAYAKTGNKPDLTDDPLLNFAFVGFAGQIDRDNEKYDETCKKRSEAGKISAANKNTCQQNQQVLTKPTSVNKSNKDKYKDKYKEKEKEKEIDKEKEKFSAVAEEFNRVCVSLPKVERLTDTRKQRIKRAREMLEDVSFTDFFNRVERSDFLTGRSGEWKATFDWILKPENLTKILEGNYDNRSKAKGVYSKAGASFDVDKYKRSSLFDD